jgi:FKBP-type peptidyl-prolyl cis-trans isomerase
MLTSSRYNTQKEYLDACTSSTHLIYEITLESFTPDPEQTAKTQLSTFVHNNFSDADNVSYVQDQEPDGTFWFSSDVSSFKEEDALETGATIKINYTGRLLDGTVFDTTLEKVAKDAGIYNASRTYEPQSVSLASTYSDITMGGSSSLINGFKGALYLMHWKGQKANALFTSSHGYSSSGSGSSIPGYASLWFELEIVE